MASAAAASPIRPIVRGTPPLTAHTTPVPAQAMHFNRPRRLTPAVEDISLSGCLLTVLSCIGYVRQAWRPETLAGYSRRHEKELSVSHAVPWPFCGDPRTIRSAKPPGRRFLTQFEPPALFPEKTRDRGRPP